MDIKPQPSLKFLGVDVVNLEYSVAKRYDKKAPIDIKITPKVFYPKDKPLAFQIIMDVSLESIGFFKIELSAIGLFNLSIDLEDKIKRAFVNTNAPAIMFPYVRSFISMFTASSGNLLGGALTIPPHFFKGNIEEFKPKNKVVKTVSKER